MHARCIIVSFFALLSGCATPDTLALQAENTPPSNRTAPILPRSDEGLDPTWFIGAWRVQDGPCTLRLDRDASSLLEGPVHADQCISPWSDTVRWQRPEDGRSLFELVTADGHSIWRAGAIQPTAIAGLSSAGVLTRLYWAGDGPHPGWFSPEGHTTP